MKNNNCQVGDLCYITTTDVDASQCNISVSQLCVVISSEATIDYTHVYLLNTRGDCFKYCFFNSLVMGYTQYMLVVFSSLHSES